MPESSRRAATVSTGTPTPPPADVKPVFIWGRTPIDYAGFRDAGQEKLGRLVTRTAPP